VRPTKAAASKLVSLCLDMEEFLNEAQDAARAVHLIGHGLHEFVNENEAGAVVAAAWNACQKVEALKRMWRTCSRPRRMRPRRTTAHSSAQAN
jgi:hypothetical protein